MSTPPTTDGSDPAGLDLADVALHVGTDQAEVWRRLRDEHPLYWNPARDDDTPGFWAVTRHADVCAVYRDAATFTSQRGNLLTALLRGGDTGAGQMIAVTDGPRHHAIRSLLAPSLGPRALTRLAAKVTATTERLLDSAVARRDVDFAHDVAAHIPLTTICDLLGVPTDDRAFIQRQTSVALGSDNPDQSPTEIWLARNEILLYFRELCGLRRRTPADDLVSVLANGRIDGEEISEDEVVLNCYSLILGGDETARLSMAGAVAAFAAWPEQWHRLQTGQAGLAAAVEEVLRWTTPALHAGRTARYDTDLHGRTIKAGDIVTVWNVAANFDEREFAEPGEFDLGRKPNRHVSFGYGTHFCLGASLARIELSALLAGLRDRVQRIEISAAPARIFSNFLAGYSSLPVTLTPAGASRS